MIYIFFYKKTSGGAIKNENMSNKELVEEICNPTIRKFNKRKVHSSFTDNIWSAVLGDVQLRSKFNKEIRFLSCVIDIFSRYAWVIPLKNEKSITISDASQNLSKKSNCKPSKIWIDKGNEFYNRPMKSWLEKMA